MANRFDRLNLFFDFERTGNNYEEREEEEEEGDAFEIFESSDDRSSSSGSSVEKGNRKRRRNAEDEDDNDRRREFRVYANPFDQNRYKRKGRSRGNRKNDNGKSSRPSSSSSSSFAPVARGSSVSIADSTTAIVPQIPGNNGNATNGRNFLMTDEWNPCSISEDIAVFNKYGVDPKHVHEDGKSCYGCNVQCDSIPVKQSNMKVLLEKIAQSGMNSGNALNRAEIIRSNYLDLIVEPKRKLQRLLNDSKRNGSDEEIEEEEEEGGRGEENGEREKEDEEEREFCDRSFHSRERPSKSRKLNSGSSTRTLTEKKGFRKEDKIDEWNTMGIYNHLRHHQMNVIDQVQYRRARLWDMMEEMERNSLFVEHGNKKNPFGERLKRADPDQFKVYSDVLKNWILLSKSRPDLMRPFYDPDKIGNQGLSNNKEAQGEIINVSGQLLFGKKKR
jgi:hypothetical protein